MRLPSLISLLFLTLASPLLSARELPTSGPLLLEENDTVLFLGDGFFEREGDFGFIEAEITARFPEKNIRFRNLAWNGDTPRGESRSYFGPPEEGFQRLQKNLGEVKPSVIFANYGASNVAEGEPGIAPFIAAYERLLDSIKATGAGVVLVSPAPRMEVGPNKAVNAKNNALARKYADAIQALAAKRNLRYVDLLGALKDVPQWQDASLAVHGLQFTESGYKKLAPATTSALLGNVPAASTPASPGLVTAIRKKNELFFHRWRPANETYLFGFRKHEQGNNGVEIPQFDPLIAQAEQKIAEVRRSVAAP
jgi:lysophospholipase L1-like esterase